jgi:hypothetical protein
MVASLHLFDFAAIQVGDGRMKITISEWSVPFHALCGAGSYKIMAQFDGHVEKVVLCHVHGRVYKDPDALEKAEALASTLRYAARQSGYVALSLKEIFPCGTST